VGSLQGTGLRPLFLEKFARRGVKLPAAISPTSVAQPLSPAARSAAR
jgi:hypothetical protein